MNIGQALAFASEKLKSPEINKPLYEAELLLSHTLKKEREFLFTHPEAEIGQKKFIEFRKLLEKRKHNFSIAYLCGYKYFFGLKFFINADVLVPRPETELMVEEALRHTNKNTVRSRYGKILILDIGTGSGCISIATAKELQKSNKRLAGYEFHAVDISKKALKIAKKNAAFHNVKNNVSFYHGDLLEPILKKRKKEKGKIIICANLPYLTPAQIKDSPSIRKEPKLALAAGRDGLKYYRALFRQISQNLLPRQSDVILLIEIDHTQKACVTKLIREELPQAKFTIKKDLSGFDRLVSISFS